MPPLIAHANALEIAQSFHLYQYFVFASENALVSLHVYIGSPEPSVLGTDINTRNKIECAGSFDLFFALSVKIKLAWFDLWLLPYFEICKGLKGCNFI